MENPAEPTQLKSALELVDAKGDSIESIKASNRTRSHLLNDTKRFESMSELEKSAENIHGKEIVLQDAIHIKDKENGFDINDIDSVTNFDAGYTPLGNSLLIKVIKEEQKIGSVLVPDSSNLSKKAVVVVPGLLVTSLKAGDIVSIKPAERGSIQTIDRILKGVKFDEIDYHAIAGIFKSSKEMKERIKADYIEFKSMEG